MTDYRPNAHIEGWLAEWRDEAKSKGHQSQHTFAKALASLRAYPLPLTSGKEAQILKNFGPALCQMIDKRLKEYQRDNPVTFRDSWDEPAPSAVISKPTSKKQTGKTAKHEVEDDDSEIENSQNSPKKKPRTGDTTRQSKDYLPAYRSGGFALLIALLEHSRDPSSTRGYMTKAELIEAAQPNCDTSFKPQARGGIPTGPNAFFYTAWSSMSTLIKKSLVSKEGNPARFALTESGFQLAERLQATLGTSQESSSSKACSKPPMKPQKKPAPTATSQASYKNSTKILTTYVKADYSSDEEDSDATSELLYESHSLPNPSSVGSNATGNSQPAMARSSSTSSSNFVPKMVKASSTASSTSSRQPLKQNTEVTEEVYDLLSSNITDWEVVLCVDNQEYYGTASKKNLITDLMKLGVRTEVRRLSVGDYLWVLRRKAGTSGSSNPSERDIVLDYVMERKRIDDLVSSIIDGRFKEQKTRMKNSGRPKTIYLIEEFSAWAANTTGWKLSINPSSLLQTVVNTLMIDEFELKMTRDSHHTAVMLAALSRHIEKAVQDVAAKCRRAYAVTIEEMCDLLTHPVSSPARFGEWNTTSAKTRPMTIRETFARQLMCIQGVSADRAMAITSCYPVPASLLDACSLNENDCEKTLASLKIGTRKLGPAVSKKIVSFYSKF